MRNIILAVIATIASHGASINAQAIFQDSTFTEPVVVSFANEFVTFQNCRFENITGTALSIEASGVFISGCTFENINGNAIESTLGEVYLLGDTIRNVSGWGIVGQYGVVVAYSTLFEQIAGLGVYGEDCDVLEVSGCRFESVGAGIYSASLACENIVSNTVFHNVNGSLSGQFMGYPIFAAGGGSLSVESCTIDGCTASAIVATQIGGVPTTQEPVKIQDNTIANAAIDGISGYSFDPNCAIRNNTISFCGNAGLYWSSPDASIEGNHIHHMQGSDGVGIVIFQAAKVSRNLVHDCTTDGARYLVGESQSSAALQFYNNIIYGNGGSAIYYDGYADVANTAEPVETVIKNNTFHALSDGTSDKPLVSIVSNGAPVRIVGNILMVEGQADTSRYVELVSAAAVDDYLNLKAPGDIGGFVDYSGRDFHLASEDSPAHNFLPFNFGPPNDDFDGEPRFGQWDAGADQLSPAPSICGCTNCPDGIPDLGSKEYIFGVAAAENNDLSSGQQGVCGVRVSFEHEYLGDMSMLLISPAGQVIQLIGPSGFWGSTKGTLWDVGFVPCGETATPDPGFAASWSSNQAWGSSTNYAGLYYPAQGCLENFNSGSVTGNWILRAFDNHANDTGVIRGFEVMFCDMAGVSCLPCIAPPRASLAATNAAAWGISIQNLTLGGANWYTIDYGDGHSFSGLSVPAYHEYENAGNYLVKLIAFNDCGADTASVAVHIPGAPPVAFAYMAPQSGCAPLVAQAIVISADRVDEWRWLFPGGTPSESFEMAPTVTYAQPGTYTVTLILTNEVGTTKIEHLDTLVVLPGVANLSFNAQALGPNITCVNTTQNAQSFYWTLNGGTPEGHNTSPFVFEVGSSGTYTVALYASDACQTYSTSQEVEVIILNTALLGGLNWHLALSPNPTHGSCLLSLQADAAGPAALRVLDALGRVVFSEKTAISEGENAIPLHLGHLPPGGYVMQVQTEKGAASLRLVIQ